MRAGGRNAGLSGRLPGLAFNTTTSMGRLTLNMLLSFAQFEREITGERIRDKVAASNAFRKDMTKTGSSAAVVSPSGQ